MTVRVGVAGTGHWADSAHLPSIAAHPDARLAAIADPYVPNRDRAAARFEPDAVFADPMDMLARAELDALVVATPHVYHYEIASAAIARGLHVLVEKPFVLEPAHGRELIAAAERAGVEIIVGYPWHYNDQAIEARDWIADGRIGKVGYVQSFFGSDPLDLYRGQPEADTHYGSGKTFFGPRPTTYSDPRLAGGGQGQTQMTHSLALLLFLTGLVPRRVSAFMEASGAPVDVNDALSIRFDDGVLGMAGSTGAVVPYDTDLLQYQIHGSDGHLWFDVSEGDLRLWTRDEAVAAPSIPPGERYPQFRPAANLIDVALGRAANGSGAGIAQHTVELLAAAYRSAALDGAPVEVGAT